VNKQSLHFLNKRHWRVRTGDCLIFPTRVIIADPASLCFFYCGGPWAGQLIGACNLSAVISSDAKCDVTRPCRVNVAEDSLGVVYLEGLKRQATISLVEIEDHRAVQNHWWRWNDVFYALYFSNLSRGSICRTRTGLDYVNESTKEIQVDSSKRLYTSTGQK
jgi:hypothetical protein